MNPFYLLKIEQGIGVGVFGVYDFENSVSFLADFSSHGGSEGWGEHFLTFHDGRK